MILQAMKFVEQRLNRYLLGRYPSQSDWVVLSGITQNDGSVPLDVARKIALTLINIERDPVATNTQPRSQNDAKGSAVMNPTLRVNLDVLISAHFDDTYADGLELLSSAIGFFQGSSIYSPQTAPDLPPGLDRLTTEWVDLDVARIHQLWTVLGGRYRPSVLYKFRMLSFQSGWITGEVPAITGVVVET